MNVTENETTLLHAVAAAASDLVKAANEPAFCDFLGGIHIAQHRLATAVREYEAFMNDSQSA